MNRSVLSSSRKRGSRFVLEKSRIKSGITSRRVGYLGIPGSFSHIAALRYFGGDVSFFEGKSFQEILKTVQNQDINYAILPIENSVSGSVVKNYDLLLETNVTIIGEIYLRVSQNLLVKRKLSPKAITKIFSHPEAFKQCEEFLSRLTVTKIEMSDTATAAKYVSEKGKNTEGAIASIDAAKLYSLIVLKKHIETNKANYTRFIVIARKTTVNNSVNKATLLFTVKHKPGTLYKVLGALANRSLNLTKIESRPMLGSPFEYMFYMDFEFDSIEQAKEAIRELEKETTSLRILGKYKKGELYED